MSSKRRDVVALDDDGKREHLERNVACRKREVGPLSLLLIVRGIHADPDLFRSTRRRIVIWRAVVVVVVVALAGGP